MIFGEYKITEQQEKKILDYIRELQKKYGAVWSPIIKWKFGQELYYAISKYLKVVGQQFGEDLIVVDESKAFEITDEKRMEMYFKDIYGYDEYKAKIIKILTEERGRAVLLAGAPGTGKTLFLDAIAKLPNAELFVATEVSKAGINKTIKNLYEKFGSNFILCIDEFDKLYRAGASDPFRDQKMFLNILDTYNSAKITRAKYENGDLDSYNIKLDKMKVFVAVNDTRKIDPDFILPRLDPKFYFPPYDRETYIKTAVEILTKKFHKNPSLALKIASYFADHFNKERNIRTIINIGDLFDSEQEFDEWVRHQEELERMQRGLERSYFV